MTGLQNTTTMASGTQAIGSSHSHRLASRPRSQVRLRRSPHRQLHPIRVSEQLRDTFGFLSVCSIAVGIFGRIHGSHWQLFCDTNHMGNGLGSLGYDNGYALGWYSIVTESRLFALGSIDILAFCRLDMFIPHTVPGRNTINFPQHSLCCHGDIQARRWLIVPWYNSQRCSRANGPVRIDDPNTGSCK